MASAFLLPHCSVCNKSLQYGGPDPYLLPCLHAACADCLAGNNTTVLCSNCNEIFNKGEYIFLKDTVTQNELFVSTAKTNPSRIQCTSKTHKETALVWCVDCDVLFCRSCQASHSQVKSSHTHNTVMVKHLTSGGATARRTRCPEHDQYYLDLYDVTCEILVCSKCARARGEHAQCRTEEVNQSIGSEDREIIIGQITKLETRLREVIAILEASGTTELDTSHAEMRLNVKRTFDDIRSSISERERDLLRSLDTYHSRIKRRHTSSKRKLERTADKLQVAHDYAKKLLKEGNAGEFLTLKNNVRVRTELCLKEEVRRVVVETPVLSFSMEQKNELKAMIAILGDIDLNRGSGSYQASYENVTVETCIMNC